MDILNKGDIGKNLVSMLKESNWWDDFVGDDITFCVSPCNETSCIRHKSNCRRPDLPHSVSLLYGTEYCPLSSYGRGYEDTANK